MRKYELYCSTHGLINIEVEKPPMFINTAPKCPFCMAKLLQIGDDKPHANIWASNGVGSLLPTGAAVSSIIINT